MGPERQWKGDDERRDNGRKRDESRRFGNGAGDRRRSGYFDGEKENGDGAECGRRRNRRVLCAPSTPSSDFKNAQDTCENDGNGPNPTTGVNGINSGVDRR